MLYSIFRYAILHNNFLIIKVLVLNIPYSDLEYLNDYSHLKAIDETRLVL